MKHTTWFRNKLVRRILGILLILSLTGCSMGEKGVGEEVDDQKKVSFQKEVQRISRYPSGLPENYGWIDYRERALAFDSLVFDQGRSGGYLPLIWQDSAHQSFGIPAYVGDGRMGKDGAQEAVTVIAAVLSATQLGVDKSSQDGINYVKQLAAFYSEEEGILLNNPDGSSETTSMWYLLYPAILFTQVSLLYPKETEVRELALNCIDRWYEAYQVMKQTKSFSYTGFNFKKMEPYSNHIWTEPDCVAGIAFLLYYGYYMTGKDTYLAASMEALQALEDYSGSPLYEALLYFAPYLAAMFNARYGMDLDPEDFLNDILNGGSIPRGGWGSLTGTWGGYPVNGLMGSTTDGGGYAFAMNTFTAAYALSPLARYDMRYAAAMGKWFLNVASNSRYFFADQTKLENQSASLNSSAQEFSGVFGKMVPYEGIRKSAQSKTPWFGGDPTVYGWAETDFSLYSGAHLGLFASIVQPTDVEGILKIDLTRAELCSDDVTPAFLLYNPYPEEKTVTYRRTGEEKVDLYQMITGEYLGKAIEQECKLQIPGASALVVFELPAGSAVEEKEGRRFAGGKFICADAVSAGVVNYQNNDTVSGRIHFQIAAVGTQPEDVIRKIIVTVGDKSCQEENSSSITVPADDVGTGSKTFQFEVLMESGRKDRFELRLSVE